MQSHNIFFALVADPRAQVEQLQALAAEEKINVNLPGLGGVFRPIDNAVKTGNVNVVRWLIEECKAEVASVKQLFNLLELATRNPDPAVLIYLANPERRIWARFNDQTTDLHVDALCGRSAQVAQILSADPLARLQMSVPTKNVFYWALMGEQQSVLSMLITFSDEFISSRIMIADTKNVHVFFYSMRSYAKIHGNVFPTMVKNFAEKIAEQTSKGANDGEVIPAPVLDEWRRCLVDQQCFLGELAQQDFNDTEDEPDQSRSFRSILPWYMDSLKLLKKIKVQTDADSKNYYVCYIGLADAHEFYALRLKEDGEDILVLPDGKLPVNKLPVNMNILYENAIDNFNTAIGYIEKAVPLGDAETRVENNKRIADISLLARVVRQRLARLRINALYDYEPENAQETDSDSDSEADVEFDTDADTDADTDVEEEIKPEENKPDPGDEQDSSKRRRLR